MVAWEDAMGRLDQREKPEECQQVMTDPFVAPSTTPKSSYVEGTSFRMKDQRRDLKTPYRASLPVHSLRHRFSNRPIFTIFTPPLAGSQEFREMLLKLSAKTLRGTPSGRRMATGSGAGDHGKRRAERILQAGLEHFGIGRAELRSTAKGDWRKGVLAALIQKEGRCAWIGSAKQ